jgi:acyl carrier protein
MDRQSLLRLIEPICDVPANSLTGRELLADLDGWDSIAILSFIALADEKFRVSVAPSDINASRTIADLVVLVLERTH